MGTNTYMGKQSNQNAIDNILARYGMEISETTGQTRYKLDKTIVFLENERYPIVIDSSDNTISKIAFANAGVDPAKVTDIQYASTVLRIQPDAFDGMNKLSSFTCHATSQVEEMPIEMLDATHNLKTMTYDLQTATVDEVKSIVQHPSIEQLIINVNPLDREYLVPMSIVKALDGEEPSPEDYNTMVDLFDGIDFSDIDVMFSPTSDTNGGIRGDEIICTNHLPTNGMMFRAKFDDPGYPTPGTTQDTCNIPCSKCCPYPKDPFDPNKPGDMASKQNLWKKSGKPKISRKTKSATNPKTKVTQKLDVTTVTTPVTCVHGRKGNHTSTTSEFQTDLNKQGKR